MSNPKNEIKFPKKEGLAEARKKLKEMRRKEPSSELVKIIEDVTNEKKPSQDDIAAKSPRSRDAEV